VRKITKFTTSGAFTKQATTKLVDILCWNGGGGGGSGRQGLTAAAGGGGGGCGGGVLVFSGLGAFFNTTETVTIGSGARLEELLEHQQAPMVVMELQEEYHPLATYSFH
jgi:hypothetical protein